MKKNKKKKNKRNESKKILAEKKFEEAKKNRVKIENDINQMLDELSVEELTELENMGDFSKEAIEWIRMRKKRKKAKKEQEEFEKRLRANDEVIRRTVLVGKLAGIKNGEYKPKNKKEENLLKAILEEQEQDMDRGAREKDKERSAGDTKGRSGGAKEDKQR